LIFFSAPDWVLEDWTYRKVTSEVSILKIKSPRRYRMRSRVMHLDTGDLGELYDYPYVAVYGYSDRIGLYDIENAKWLAYVSETVPEDTWLECELVRRDNVFEVWMNGVEKVEYTDPTPSYYGDFGYRVPGDYLARFDNLEVEEI